MISTNPERDSKSIARSHGINNRALESSIEMALRRAQAEVFRGCAELAFRLGELFEADGTDKGNYCGMGCDSVREEIQKTAKKIMGGLH